MVLSLKIYLFFEATFILSAIKRRLLYKGKKRNNFVLIWTTPLKYYLCAHWACVTLF